MRANKKKKKKKMMLSRVTKLLPAFINALITDTTFSSAPNSLANLSSFSRSTNDFIAEKLELALSLMGEEPLDDARRSFMEL